MTMTTQAPAGGGPEQTGTAPPAIAALTAGSGPAAARVFPGLPEQAAQARRWVRALALRPGAADPDALGLVVTELFANAIVHTRSGRPGGKVTVLVTADGVIHVHDQGPGGGCPGLAAGPPEGDNRPESGRGLMIVAALGAGPVHLPAAWCPAARPDDPAAGAGGCCTCCRPGPGAEQGAGDGRS